MCSVVDRHLPWKSEDLKGKSCCFCLFAVVSKATFPSVSVMCTWNFSPVCASTSTDCYLEKNLWPQHNMLVPLPSRRGCSVTSSSCVQVLWMLQMWEDVPLSISLSRYGIAVMVTIFCYMGFQIMSPECDFQVEGEMSGMLVIFSYAV